MKRALMVFCGVVLAGCGGTGSLGPKPDATADLMSAGGKKLGTASFNEGGGKVRLVVDVAGLAPGKHGVHVHAIGQCQDPAFMSAGSHFNPAGKKHGLESSEGAHAGDLPNLEADANGKAHYDVTMSAFTLAAGALSVFDADGSALVIHENEDDQKTDPTGNSGARVACGVIARPR